MAGLQTLDPYNLLVPVSYTTPDADKVRVGSLISFQYPKSYANEPYYITDKKPMVIIAKVAPTYIHCVNLHYLSVQDVKQYLLDYARNPSFTWDGVVKSDPKLAGSFRMYYRYGMMSIRRLDTDFLMNLLNAVRSFSPNELERIRKVLRDQINQRLQVKASELNAYTKWLQDLNRRPMTPQQQPTPAVPQQEQQMQQPLPQPQQMTPPTTPFSQAPQVGPSTPNQPNEAAV